MIFVDANILMYLVGPDHPHKSDARVILRRLQGEDERLVTDAEVFQEILHRFSATSREADIQPAFDALHALVEEVFPVGEADVFRAKDLLATHRGLSARDALHVAIMRHQEVHRILTFDRGFDLVAGIQRIPS